MTAITRLDLPYVQARGDGGLRTMATQLIVIHATDNTASAENEAAYASRRPDLTSAHVYVDEDSAVQALNLDHEAYGCYYNGNMRSIQLELCGLSNQISAATVTRAAGIVANIATAWGIPITHVTPAQMREGVKGICGHADVTEAWHQGDHTDPGTLFPWESFLAQASGVVGAPAPTPPPAIPHYIPGSRTVLRGSWGTDVAFLQRWLGVRDDGDFGPVTAGAVRRYQRMRGLVDDGICGPRTWRPILTGHN